MHTSWDASWQGMVESEPPDLEAPVLENAIDALKMTFLRPVLPSQGVAVEIGCGSARLLARVGQAARLGLIAVDTSSVALRVATQTAERNGLTMQCINADARSIPLPANSADLVLSGGLLEHFPNPEFVLREMIRILKPGGIFYADVVPRKFSVYRIREAWRMLRTPYLMPGVFESASGPSFYREQLTALGCNTIEIRSCGVYPPYGTLRLLPLTRVLDGTLFADLLGWYFMIRARKKEDWHSP